MKISFIQTGGTIDKQYPKSKGGYAFEIGEASFVEIIERIMVSFEYEFFTAFRKDSQDITLDDIEALRELILSIESSRIIITHGSDTLLNTAEKIGHLDKTIIFTASFSPHIFKDSDAEFNLGVAIGAAQTLPRGTYVAMNGIVSPYQDITRDPINNKFLSI